MLAVFRLSYKDDLFSAVRQVRQEVFVLEQGVSQSDEYDKYESIANHYLIRKDGVNCGVARWRKTDKGIKLERFAVVKHLRGFAIGKRLVEEVLRDVSIFKLPIYLHAQIQVVDFYQKLGFVKEGNLFEEAGIKHYKMLFKSSLSSH